MYRRSVNPLKSYAFLDAVLDACFSAPPAALLFPVTDKLELFKNDVNPTPYMGWGAPELVPADFAGYAAVSPLAWTYGVLAGSDGLLATAQGIFTANGLAAGQTIYGYAIHATAGDPVRLAERFETPVEFAEDLQFLELDVILQLDWHVPVTPW